MCGERDLKLSRSPSGLGERAEGTRSRASPVKAPVSCHPFPSVLPGRRSKTLRGAKKLRVTPVASEVQQNCDSRSLIPGDLGATPTSGAFLHEGKVETDAGVSAFVPVAPPQGSATSGGVGR